MNTTSDSNKTPKVFLKERKRFLIKAVIILLVSLSSVSYAANRFTIGIEMQDEFRCLPWTFYLIDTHQRDIRPGQYFAYEAQQMAPIVNNGTTALKKAAAGNGDKVTIGLEKTLVNGEPQVNSELMLADTIKHLYGSLEALVSEMTVGEGEIFAMGTLPGSYDSRYWGTVSENQVIGRAYPIW